MKYMNLAKADLSMECLQWSRLQPFTTSLSRVQNVDVYIEFPKYTEKNEIGKAFTSILIGGRHKFIETKGGERPFSRNLRKCRYRFVE